MRQFTIVVPCFNEAKRLQPDVFSGFVARDYSVRFIFVDDGSTDETAEILAQLCRRQPDRFDLMTLPKNVGQGEAVRVGMTRALSRGDCYLGYWDADLATPLSEIPRFIDRLDNNSACLLVLGSRSEVCGGRIHRHPLRRVLGRMFATVASTVLHMRIYDTQCGAKLFRRSPEIEELFARPFISRWIFDVELLARLIRQKGSAQSACASVVELPLSSWHEVAGSKLRASDFAKAPWEMARIGWELYRRSQPEVVDALGNQGAIDRSLYVDQ